MKDFRFMGDQVETLGCRLDAARKSLANAKSAWAQNYWQLTMNQLLRQWHELPLLHDAEAQVTMIPRWQVSYDFYEGNTEGPIGFAERFYYSMIKENQELTASWENHRAQRLAKAQ